ncbi:mannose-6-phosphate isomerase [Sphingomonas gellani]|uniref:Mannose-6-phosphate isomerase n=1 Tax=Sphingomonas gellani TaxID=1166340 RepID=A0A1H8I6B3_9SPHN|nr:AGE family epimerase/isomerase [Sphingomonas gellani]SEN64183.1 mannose-6-phosphate isomerase [Sphingomonas gellani]
MSEADSVTSFVRWNREEALPVWASRGFGASGDRFHERLDRSGYPLAVPHRAMVQARQIYVFAHAAELGWYVPGAELAEQAMAALRRDFCDDGAIIASVAFSIDPHSGRQVSTTRDSYTHAFVLFAIAHLYRLNGDPALLRFAERVAAFVERDMVDPVHGGVIDTLPAASTAKRQNPQMHLLEAWLALEDVAPGRGWLERADTLVSLFQRHMGKTDRGVLLEHFAQDWSPHPDPTRANIFEPGHHYEWAWLLDRHGQLSRQDHESWRTTLHTTATKHGHAPGGLIHDEVEAGGRVAKPSHRLWPHTEAIKAAAARHRDGDGEALGEAGRMASLLDTHFLAGPFAGGWTDHISPAGEPLVDYVPASSLYHLFLAATEADRMIDR